MFRHNLLLIFRNIKRSKGSFFINVIGLCSGMACTLLIYLWVQDEMGVDRFHENDSRLYQVIEQAHNSDRIVTGEYVSGPLAQTLTSEFPGVEKAVSFRPAEQFTLTVGDNNIKAMGVFAGQDYFNIFSYPLLRGSKNNVLDDKSSIVISEPMAVKLFNGNDQAIGKSITFQHGKQYRVTGVFQIPSNSSQQFDFALPFDEYRDMVPIVKEWKYTTAYTYVLLKNGTNIDHFNTGLSTLFEKKTGDSTRTLLARKYSDGYLYGKYEKGKQAGGRIEYVRLFSLIAIFILVIACVNFMNLSTAKASKKMKEVGIKKTLGALRGTLAFQYLFESLLIAFLSLLLAVLIIWLFLPQFNDITGKHLSLHFTGGLILAFALITALTGLVAGSYPALYLSGFSPVKVLKGKLPSSVAEVLTRKGLVVFQFTLSVILIISVLVIYKQIEFIQNKNLGYNKDNIVYFDREGKVAENTEAFLTDVKKLPGVVNASSIGQTIVGDGLNTISELGWEGKKPSEKIVFEIRPVNYDMIEMLGMGMAEGSSFSKSFGTQDTKLIFNETAIKEMGLKDPIGKQVTIQGGKFEILGVVKDFHFASLHEKVNPLFFILRPDWTSKIMVKLAPGSELTKIESLQRLYQSYNPGYPFEYKFLDQDYQAQYISERRVSILSRYFAILAIIISCLGLFGLSAFTAERRMKEISIRKVLGSGTARIVYLLTADFSKMVVLAILIAFPISYIAIRQWLSGFAFRISIAPWYFLVSGAFALLMAWLTVGMQALKAARSNPLKSIRES